MAEFQGQNRTSCPPQAGASSACGQAGIPPGNSRQQGANPSAGPPALGAKLGGSAHGPTAAKSGGGAGIPTMAELQGPNGTSCPAQGGASPGAGPPAPGAKLGGSAPGPTAADSDGGAGIPTMRAELQGPNGMSCPLQGGADPGTGPAAPGAKLGGSAHRLTAAEGSGGAGTRTVPMSGRGNRAGPPGEASKSRRGTQALRPMTP